MTNSDVRADRLTISDFVLEAMMSERAGTHKGALSLEAADKIIAYFAALPSPANPSPPAMDREAAIALIRDEMMSTDHPVSDWERAFADKIIALAGTGGGVPEGFVVIPVEVLEAGTLMMTANTVTFCADDRATANKVYEALAGVTSTSPDESRSAEGEILGPDHGRFEDHPIGKLLCDRRAMSAGDFSPQHSGQRGQDWDNGFIAAVRIVEDFLRTHRGGEK